MTGRTPTRIERWLAFAATLAATLAWIGWSHAGLTLSHYDAKAHLVVARRVIDNLTPGWQQIGAVWLPLPHLINLAPTQIDFFYRTGAFASAVSVACFGITAWAGARFIQRHTGSAAGMIATTLLLALNPNLLYLHATPMSEPLLIAVSFLVVLWLDEWLSGSIEEPVPGKLHLVMCAAAWTRYEAWLVLAAALGLAALSLLARRVPVRQIGGVILRLAAWPALAVALFLLNSRMTVGSWFVSNGFYVPDPTYQGLVARSALAVWWGTHQLSGYVLEVAGLAAAGMIVVRGGSGVVVLSLFSTAALPFYAFVEGHPFRIRYMVPLVAACALAGGLGIGLIEARLKPGGRTLAALLAAVLILSTLIESPTWRTTAPLIAESTWDIPASLERRAVTRCLAPAYRGEKILASMGSLAHYMQELSAEGFDIADFINEGNGTIWNVAVSSGPAPHAGWMLVEETAEGGDLLAQRIRADATFADGMVRVCEGGGVALYRRSAADR